MTRLDQIEARARAEEAELDVEQQLYDVECHYAAIRDGEGE